MLLGDSRLKYATLQDEELGRLAEKRTADNVFLRIVYNQAQFSDFAPFLDTILDIAPDLVLLQEPLLSRQRDEDVDLRVLQKLIIWAIVDGKSVWNPHGIDQEVLQFSTPCHGTRLWQVGYKLSAAQFDALVSEVRDRGTPDVDGPNAAAVRAFVNAARESGTEVAVLRLPATADFFRIVKTAFPDRASTMAAADTVAASWKYPGEFSSNDYCDLMHLNADARAKLSRWLATTAVRKLELRDEGLKLARLRGRQAAE